MSKLPPLPHWCESGSPFAEQMQAYATAATEPLLQRIAELEKALKLVQQHHATAWNRGHIAGMAANRMVAQDALNAVKKDAWNNTQLTEALMAAESRCEELERQLEEAHKALHDAATSLNTISELAGYPKKGGVETFMDTFLDVRLYARSRHQVARDAINAYYLQPHVKKAHEAIRAAMQKGKS